MVRFFKTISHVGICSMEIFVERARVDRLVVKVVELVRQVIKTVSISFVALNLMPADFYDCDIQNTEVVG